MRNPNWRFYRVIAAATCLLGWGEAQGSIIPTIHVGAPTAEGSNFRYTYDVTLTQDQKIDTSLNSAFFTIYDFKGFVAGSDHEPAGWTFSGQLTGTTPTSAVVADDPTIPNLTWTYSGPNLTGPRELGAFSALSTLGESNTLGSFTGQATKNAPGEPENNTRTFNGGSITVPGAQPTTPVPEPSTIMLCCTGFGLLALRRRSHRKSAA